MAEELGKIEKPEASKFAGKKKLYLVPLVFTWQDAPPDYTEKYRRYWQQIGEQIDNLESRIGRIKRIFHESIAIGGETGLKLVERLSPDAFKLASQKQKKGAGFESLEDEELVSESLDWQRMLLLGFASAKVAKMVTDYYTEAIRKRYENISQRLSEAIQENEASLLFIREGHMVQFPADIEVFSVSPPALDEINRWLKDQERLQQPPDEQSEPEQPAPEAESKPKKKKPKGKSKS
jgi:hypothetical protein